MGCDAARCEWMNADMRTIVVLTWVWVSRRLRSSLSVVPVVNADEFDC